MTIYMPYLPVTHNTVTVNAMTVTTVDGATLQICSNGDIKWSGSMLSAAKQLVNSLQHVVDSNRISKHAMARSYMRGVEKCLRLAKTMDKDQLIARLEEELENRESHVTLLHMRHDDEEQ